MSNTKTLMCPEADRLCIVVPEFRQWTGAAVLREEDFSGELPPKEVIAQMGMKAVIDRKKLDVFAAIKQRAIRLLKDRGVPFLSGWAIPLDRAGETLSALDTLVSDYESAKEELLSTYQESVEAWIRQNPSFETQIRASVKSREDVDNRIGASYSAVKVVPLSDEQAEKFNEEIRGLGPALLRAVAQTASKVQVGSLDGSHNRPRPQLVKIREKLAGLSFLDSGIEPLIRLLDGLLSKLPTSGKIEPSLFFELQAVVSILSDVNRMKAIADGRMSLEVWIKNFEDSSGVRVEHQDSLFEEGSVEIEACASAEDTQTTIAVEAAESAAETDEELEASLNAFVESYEKPAPEPITKTEETETLDSVEEIEAAAGIQTDEKPRTFETDDTPASEAPTETETAHEAVEDDADADETDGPLESVGFEANSEEEEFSEPFATDFAEDADACVVQARNVKVDIPELTESMFF